MSDALIETPQASAQTAAPLTADSVRTDYQLSDNLQGSSGQVFLTGTQALVRLLLMQRARDRAAGLNTAAFVSGYRGSPLGMVDQQLWKARKLLDAAGVSFLPAINEDLAATACLGTQRVALDPQRHVDGVAAMWYGKGPGVDRAGDALKHGHVYGSSPLGGVLVVAGDDHGCVSSSMPHQSDLAMQAWSMPVLHPANVAEYLEFGLYGWALSRYSGAWVGFKAISEVVESGMTVDLDAVPLDFELPVPPLVEPALGPTSAAAGATTDTGLSGIRVVSRQASASTSMPSPMPTPAAASNALHVRAVDLPSLELEQRLAAKLDAVRRFAAINSVDKHIVTSPRATLGIVTVGKAHFDFMEVLRRLDLDPNALAAAGVRVYKVGLVFPIEPTRMLDFVAGLDEVLVIEEKAPVVERQMKELLYGLPDRQRPRIAGKTTPDGRPLLSALGELRPSRIMPVLADWLARLNPALDRRALVVDFTMPKLLSNASDVMRRQPYFCSGCPHNTSTKVPEGSRAQAGIGCHFMASWMDRQTSGLIQMGAEGVDWVAHSRFTRAEHVFQNLGDGTYYHSGYLAIRQAVAAGARITYKLLYNDAVAMTGGQPVDGRLSVAQIARQVEAEGARQVVIVSDDIAPHRSRQNDFPAGTEFAEREQMDAVQRRLREIDGVTVLIYDQTCAAEKRRRRKKGLMADPPRRVFINEQVCEGCGDCGKASNCLSVMPVQTDWGRKRQIDQTSCNKDFSCINGFCPSFVTVHGAVLRKRDGSLQGQVVTAANSVPSAEPSLFAAFERSIAALPAPKPWSWTGPFDMLVTGVGGTGVVTIGALVTMAAHLQGMQASVLDFMGFAQKGGAVLSFVRIAPTAAWLNQVRIDTQQADLVLACDLVVAASSDALGTVKHGRTEVIANLHELPTAAFVRDPDAQMHAQELMAKLQFAAGLERVRTLDAQALAQALLGDTVTANVLMLGAAFQAGLVPVSLAALQQAIRLNGVDIDRNLTALAIGRLALADPQRLQRLVDAGQRGAADAASGPDDASWLGLFGEHGLVARRMAFLTDYQDRALAQRYQRLVLQVRDLELRGQGVNAAAGSDAPAGLTLPWTHAVATQYARLLAVKDEYEVARLYTDGRFEQALRQQFERWDSLEFHLAPPLLHRWLGADAQGRPGKRGFGGWMMGAMSLLARARGLRGSWLDPFKHSADRQHDQQMLRQFEALQQRWLQTLAAPAAGALPGDHAQLVQQSLAQAVRDTQAYQRLRGYGAVREAGLAAGLP